MNRPLHVEDAKYYNEYTIREGVYIKINTGSGIRFSGPYYIEDITVDNDYRAMTSKITYVLFKPDTGTHRTCDESEIYTSKMVNDERRRCGVWLQREPYKDRSHDQYSYPYICFSPSLDLTTKKIIFSGPCTIVLWQDGTKTMARISEGEIFDPEKGVAICFMKKIIGHTETNKLLRKATKQYEEQYSADHIINKLKDWIAVKNHPLYKRPEEKEDEE